MVYFKLNDKFNNDIDINKFNSSEKINIEKLIKIANDNNINFTLYISENKNKYYCNDIELVINNVIISAECFSVENEKKIDFYNY